MQIAINYSPQAQTVIDAGALQISRYKLPDWDDLIAEAQAYNEVYVHFPLHTGRGTQAQADLDNIERLRQQTNTPYVNSHIATDYTIVGTSYEDEIPSTLDKLYDATMRDIEPLIKRWGAGMILLENAPTTAQDLWHIPRAVIRPAFITRIIEASGAKFLLDTAHAWIAAHTLGMDAIEYLDALPVQHIAELHITGTQAVAESDPLTYHDHFAMRPTDWHSAEYAIERIQHGDWGQPWIVSLEYGGVGALFEWRSDVMIIERDGQRLQKLCQASPA